jgi:hypothetical protein
VVRVNVDVLEFASMMFTVEGLNCAVVFAGSDDAVRATAPVNPAKGVIVTTYCPVAPGVTFLEVGVTDTAKSGVVEAGTEVTNVL